MNVPNGLLYTSEHEWVKLDGDIATIGITDYAQSQLGDVVFVELPQVGAATTQMQIFGTIEAVKTVSDLFAPVSGAVTEVNGKLADKPELINQDCYGEGWMIKVKVSGATTGLLSPEEYRQKVAE
ncbi:glycine cleavage system protein GcvH [candidate division KSB1 bacterium]|nr:glycine cleavage system protein GcvH [candidate division KSB1 bacterium]